MFSQLCLVLISLIKLVRCFVLVACLFFLKNVVFEILFMISLLLTIFYFQRHADVQNDESCARAI